MNEWTTPADIESKLRRRWVSGALLRAYALREPFDAVDVPLRGPTAADLADRFDEARRWAAALERASGDGQRFRVVTRSVGGRHLGRTEIPSRAVVESFEQAWRVLGIRGGAAGSELAIFDGLLAASRHVPAVRDWVLAHPIRALERADDWNAILAARDWLEWNRGSGLYLRQVDAPGVDTKLFERHRSVLAEMLNVPSSAAGFTNALGFALKPSLIRMRFDPGLFGMPAGITEAEFRLDELLGFEPDISWAIIVENEISYLSAPVPPRGVVLYGKGYDASQPASLDWLRGAAVQGNALYWGDIDTHGFAILDRVRAHLPNVRSVLMDRETLLKHRSRWGSEPTPTNTALPRLTDDESDLYADLVTDRHGRGVRLEQERVDWSWVETRLAATK
ncbi:hypothetical protein SAMN04489806_0810 [Paramicrobacterium humi]|uniref:Wadjet protein JetD C-terminal domain-containing protein n=1 Tax=Paramicrobacterium humi TaxID=640635 RepID=A0A1H4JQ29_9MICO|nr:Wadjet anti-phage system protein JetD domain-containing protein [Microbacterium humi]SEB48424.1 hypothetical protein SAMN04489806_0810 [Microbacterium humi]